MAGGAATRHRFTGPHLAALPRSLRARLRTWKPHRPPGPGSPTGRPWRQRACPHPKPVAHHDSMSRSPCRTRGAAQVSTEFLTEFPTRFAARAATGPQVRVREHVTRQVVILEVAGRLSNVVEELDLAIQLALADGPRGVVCDLSAGFEGAEPAAVEVLATAGRHVRDWPGIPVAVACSDPRVRAALTAHPLGGHLIVTASVLSALSEVLATPAPVVEWLGLAPHPSAPRAARNFVTRTLLDWGLGRVISSASLVVSELVTNSTIHAGTDIALSVAWNAGALRLTVRDNNPGLPL